MSADDAPSAPVYGAALKSEWDLAPGTVYLNHGGFGLTPRAVLAVQDDWRRRIERNPTRFMVRELQPALREAAARAAAYLGARGEDFVFIDNATSGVNAVLRSLSFAPGDEILITNLGYPAVRNAARFAAARAGAAVVEAEVTVPVADAGAVANAVAARLSNRTRLLICDHIASHSALVLPVARLAALARAAGAQTLIDGAHVPGQLAVDIPALGADYYVGNLHKWLMVPRGTGFIWARPELQRALHPLTISHGYERGFNAEFDWTGTRDPSAWLSVPAGMAFHERLGGARLMARNQALAAAMAAMLGQAWRTPHGGPGEMFAAMATVALPEAGPATQERARALGNWLAETHGVYAAINAISGRLWVRIAAQAYNEPADYERLAHAFAGKNSSAP